LASDSFAAFDYLHFAKTQFGGARHTLALSGVPDVTVADIAPPGAREAVVESAGLGPALADWRARIAARYGVPEGHSMPAVGTSGSVFLALAALDTLLPRDATIAIEHPAYGVFESGARLLRRGVVRVVRREQDRYAVDLGAVEDAFKSGARVFCVTDLHNPTGVALPDTALAGLRELARRHDAWIVLDEVYRDFRAGPVGTAYRAGERVVVTSSLTKCYGLGGLRAGWLFAPPELLARADLVEEILYGVPPATTTRLAAQALERADDLLARGRAAAAAGRPVIDAWIASTPRVSWVAPDAGITGLVRIEGLTDSKEFGARLREELDLQIVPGSFFGAEGHVRVSFGLPPRAVAAALDVLALGIGPLAS
jgi:aspartate/methionine/tyrosine aminotransferase